MDSMKDSSQPWFMSGSDVSRLVRDKKLSAIEVIDSQLQRIAAVNAKINAIVADGSHDGREMAQRFDSGQITAPNIGMTLTTKINTDHVGYASDNGVRAMAANMPHKTAPCIEGLLESGMAMVGRTNAPALSMRFHTDNELHGETLNPHGQHISCGGSSGGAAAAVAAGLCHVAQGNDVGGSVRWPAYCNGVIGLRPTIGRMVTGGTNPTLRGWSAANMATNGPIARTMEDLETAFTAMNKPNWADPFWAPVPLHFPRPDAPVKVAIVTSDSVGLHPAVVESVKEAGQVLANAGYVVEEVSPPMLDELFSLWTTIGSVDMNFGLIPMLPAINDSGLTQVFSDWESAFTDNTGLGFMKAHMVRDQILRSWNEFFATYSLVVLPGFAEPMMRRNQDREGGDSMLKVAELARYMLNIPALGIPAMSFPMGKHNDSPIGVQIAAHTWREDLIIEAGYALENHRGKITPVDPQW